MLETDEDETSRGRLKTCRLDTLLCPKNTSQFSSLVFGEIRIISLKAVLRTTILIIPEDFVLHSSGLNIKLYFLKKKKSSVGN